MKNKNVGFLVTGIGIIVIALIGIFNFTLNNFVDETCNHGLTCTMYDTISIQTYVSLSIAGLILILGLFLIFSKEQEKIILKTKTRLIKEKQRPINLEGLDNHEKQAITLLQKEGAMFQADLMERIRLGKVGMTRLLDKLEAKQLIERKRRGMNNIIVLRQ